MTYKKPKIVAKSAPKQSFAAGCPEKVPLPASNCTPVNKRCMCGPLK